MKRSFMSVGALFLSLLFVGDCLTLCVRPPMIGAEGKRHCETTKGDCTKNLTPTHRPHNQDVKWIEPSPSLFSSFPLFSIFSHFSSPLLQREALLIFPSVELYTLYSVLRL